MALSYEDSNLAMNAIVHAAQMSCENFRFGVAEYVSEATRPSAIYRPAISKDGDKWCALYGDNLQDGVCGFGDTPELAMADFDKNWRKP